MRDDATGGPNRDPRYDILFQPIRLGPVTAKNRFYQVPHCTGMGWQRPEMLAAMRGMKAEGGWGVVCTEYCSVHPTSDDGAYPHARLWHDDHIREQALMTDAVHEHGALAGAELWLGGNYVASLDTRQPTLGLRSRPIYNTDVSHPVQCRRIDRSDIADIRSWQAAAAKRAVQAGFDIVYVYACHGYLLSEFLDPATNTRTDEYGGSTENRSRLVRELIEDTLEAVAGKAAVAVRFAVDLAEPERYETFGLMADMPDLWDLTVPDYGIEMGASRFVKEASLQDSIAAAKAMTTKPVVAVGRFTSPDTMARTVTQGAQDMIGAARPSIADPFLPKKIEEGRIDDIRECIGCNICYAHNTNGVPIRCTQNPSMGEEWRRGWHPDRVPPVKRPGRALVIGGGPAGLEAARVLGARGMDVMLAEASRDLGGRVTLESRLPGLSEWARVRDWRLGQIDRTPSIEVFRESVMTAADVRAVGADHIVVATGASWVTDGIGRHRDTPMTIGKGAAVLSADAVLAGEDVPGGRVLLYDDDSYVLGPLLAIALCERGCPVTYVTPEGRPGAWSSFTNEQTESVAAMIDRGVEIVTNRVLDTVQADHAVSRCVFSGRQVDHAADWVLPLTRREPRDGLYYDLLADRGQTPIRAGDCDAPGLIAAAVWSGHKAAMAIGEPDEDAVPYRSEKALASAT